MAPLSCWQQTLKLKNKEGMGNVIPVRPQMHGKRILKLLQKIFSWLPLATVIDQKVLVIHGGISNTTDLSVLARVDRHNVSLEHRHVHFKCFINHPERHWNSCSVFVPVQLGAEASEEETPERSGGVHRLGRGGGVHQQGVPAQTLPHVSQNSDQKQLPEPLAAGLLRPAQSEHGGGSGGPQEAPGPLRTRKWHVSVLRVYQQRRRVETGEERLVRALLRYLQIYSMELHIEFFFFFLNLWHLRVFIWKQMWMSGDLVPASGFFFKSAAGYISLVWVRTQNNIAKCIQLNR